MIPFCFISTQNALARHDTMQLEYAPKGSLCDKWQGFLELGEKESKFRGRERLEGGSSLPATPFCSTICMQLTAAGLICMHAIARCDVSSAQLCQFGEISGNSLLETCMVTASLYVYTFTRVRLKLEC